ncbi:hypothetical protein QNI19_17485 [Cytophagaceae bacterium DM2B3-1]|uniref:Uncharacterized protein n=2 Tax=Xanthocytophaga TaxID=3078918 RepID=A0AAE3QJR4_9BACT|nr:MULTISPECIES: hypothetical protein [Xanthocytophaga]MDJ1473749.1 hypothetical protein [Xanthocytophaga flavus]MDJ1479901.1 hypothetical protein [Xanthocytophaga flavus]MDJ1494735.1 hypothetical protein [Xanthocytophaga flavus]MDJ1501787.1 hypothetical protein [Xanthocytophaga agilis]
MDTKKLDAALIALVEKKIQLSNMNYSDERYDEVEEQLHDMEDDFIDKYGDFLEDALEEVHDTHDMDSEVLLPTAYLAQKYEKVGQHPDGRPIYEVDHKEGVWVETEKFPGKEARLVLIPSPTRFVLSVGKHREEVWKA